MPIAKANVAVCSWSLRPTSAPDLVERLSSVQARAVQLALTPLVESSEAWKDVFLRLNDAGIEVISGMLETVGEDYSTLETIAATGGVVPDATWDATRARAERVARIAGDAGIKLVTFHAGFIPHEEGMLRDKLFARLRTLSELFAGFGSRIAFETGQESAATLSAALDALGDARIGVNFDPANMILYGMGDPVAAVRHLAPRVVQVHVKDALPSTVRGQWGSEVRVGTGAVNWAAFLTALDELPQPLHLAIEREAGEDRVSDIRAAATLLDGALA